jgi:hypothetical protein
MGRKKQNRIEHRVNAKGYPRPAMAALQTSTEIPEWSKTMKPKSDLLTACDSPFSRYWLDKISRFQLARRQRQNRQTAQKLQRMGVL